MNFILIELDNNILVHNIIYKKKIYLYTSIYLNYKSRIRIKIQFDYIG